MSDIKSPEERSRNMSKIRSKDTKPEVWFRKKLFSLGYRYRKHVNYIPGHPDLWLAKYNLAIFVNGCFWHRHQGCKYAYTPKSRTDFWNLKFQKNIERDIDVRRQLQESGIRTLILWECTVNKMVRNQQGENSTLDRIITFINSEILFLEL